MYKILLDFVFLKVYYGVYSYMINGSYVWNSVKYFFSSLFFFVFLGLAYLCSLKNDPIKNIVIILLMVICIIPMLSVYAFLSYVETFTIIYPVLFWGLLFWYINGKKWLKRRTIRIVFPSIKHASIVLLILCSFLGLICWAWAGFPILLSLSASTEARISLRENSMPAILGYIFVLLGGVIFPYLFARYLDKKNCFYAVCAIVIGFLLYSINGMKTWLFLYLFIIGIYILCKLVKGDVQKVCNFIVLIICALLVLCVAVYALWGGRDLLSQFGRVFCIPSGIGFKSINFFRQPDNPYLFLRESILRNIFESPYPGGSDFYINYGSEITISSGRANNGLWGDAFRNFGIAGILIYPFFISRVLASIARSVKHKRFRFQIIVIFQAIWNAVNVSFFTWLVTGGIIVLLILRDFFSGEDLNENHR